MALRKITVRGDEILTKKCKPVKDITDRIRILSEDMIETMTDADGVGLAGPQVGIMKRIFVARPFLDDQEKVYVMINPEITSREGEQECTEGCLSVPDMIGIVRRPQKVSVRYTGLDGETAEETFSDFAANVICHEYDHLDGIVFPDIAEQVMTQKEYEQLLAEMAEAGEAAEEEGE